MSASRGYDFLDRFGLEHPLVQAGMAGGVAGAELAGAVSAAGALGTVGMLAPPAFAGALRRARERAPGRPLAANLLVPFIRGAHVRACLEAEVPLVVFHGGLPVRWMGPLRAQGAALFVTVGTPQEARRALGAGADGLVLQGSEAGGHLLGVVPLQEALAGVLDVADGAPVLAAGGVAAATDVRRVLDAGATAAVAGTRFLLTYESSAHPLYKQRLLAASETFATLLFGLGWPLRHRVIANRATERWWRKRALGPPLVQLSGRLTMPLGRLVPLAALGAFGALQRPGLPLFSPSLPVAGMRDSSVDRTALYAGETVARLHDVIPAAQAVDRLVSDRPR
jgi:NAD(P)H-dependent flavin oxidoreductase YrpB (nitropropane dioxygenase family)